MRYANSNGVSIAARKAPPGPASPRQIRSMRVAARSVASGDSRSATLPTIDDLQEPIQLLLEAPPDRVDLGRLRLAGHLERCTIRYPYASKRFRHQEPVPALEPPRPIGARSHRNEREPGRPRRRQHAGLHSLPRPTRSIRRDRDRPARTRQANDLTERENAASAARAPHRIVPPPTQHPGDVFAILRAAHQPHHPASAM